MDPKKTAVLKEWPAPQDVGQLRSFLGMANYFRRFVEGYSNLVKPLNDYLRKKTVWKWTSDCQKAFDKAKHVLVTVPALAQPDFSKRFEVIADACGHGVGAVLLQDGHLVASESRSMLPAEQDYHIGEQELLAVVHATRIWRCYLEGVKCTVVADHTPITYLQTQPVLSRRQARWSEYLQMFDFSCLYRPGRCNVADPLFTLLLLGDKETDMLNVVGRGQSRAAERSEGGTQGVPKRGRSQELSQESAEPKKARHSTCDLEVTNAGAGGIAGQPGFAGSADKDQQGTEPEPGQSVGKFSVMDLDSKNVYAQPIEVSPTLSPVNYCTPGAEGRPVVQRSVSCCA